MKPLANGFLWNEIACIQTLTHNWAPSSLQLCLFSLFGFFAANKSTNLANYWCNRMLQPLWPIVYTQRDRKKGTGELASKPGATSLIRIKWGAKQKWIHYTCAESSTASMCYVHVLCRSFLLLYSTLLLLVKGKAFYLFTPPMHILQFQRV